MLITFYRCDSGHYVANVRRHDGWWKLNDEKATKESAEQVSKKQAYMLFFSRKNNENPNHEISD